jgi:hypothetical protein
MAKPEPYSMKVSVPLPGDAEVARVIGASYDPAKTLNVVKMSAGPDDMYSAGAARGLRALFRA